MKYKYSLPKHWSERVSQMEEYANGATQVTIQLIGGNEVRGVLISDCAFIIATRGFTELPFSMDEIEDIFQTDDDKNPRERGGWNFWDNWKSNP